MLNDVAHWDSNNVILVVFLGSNELCPFKCVVRKGVDPGWPRSYVISRTINTIAALTILTFVTSVIIQSEITYWGTRKKYTGWAHTCVLYSSELVINFYTIWVWCNWCKELSSFHLYISTYVGTYFGGTHIYVINF